MSTAQSVVKDVGSNVNRNVNAAATEVNRQAQQLANTANTKAQEYIKQVQIEFYEEKITKFLVDKFKKYSETQINADNITKYVETVINELITKLSESKSIFSSINSLIDSINGLKPKSSDFNVTKDEQKLLSIENINIYPDIKEIAFVDPFVKQKLINNLEEFKKTQSAKIVKKIFSTPLQGQILKNMNSQMVGDAWISFKSAVGLKQTDEAKKARDKENSENNSFKGYYKYLLGKKAIINQIEQKNPTHMSNMLNKYSDPVKQEGIFVEELETTLKGIYERSLEALQKLRTIQIEDVSKFVSNTIIPDAKKDIQQQQKTLRKVKSSSDANLSSYKVIPDDYIDTKDGVPDYKQFFQNFFGVTQENLTKIQTEGDEHGYFSIVFKYLFDSIGIAVSNELNQMIGRSIANVSIKYPLSEADTSALKNFGRIIVEIVKKFLSTELITIVFYSIADYYDDMNSQKGGRTESTTPTPTVTGQAKQDDSTTPPAVDNPELISNETSSEVVPSSAEKTPCKPCKESYSFHATNIFSSMGTQILNSIVKKSIVGDGTEDQQHQNYDNYIQSIKNMKTNMPTLFPEFIQDMIGYMIITLPTNIILFILAIIPIPLPYVLVESMLIKIKKDLNAIVNLIIDASSITGKNTLNTGEQGPLTYEETINNEKITDKDIKNKSAVIGQLKTTENSVNQEDINAIEKTRQTKDEAHIVNSPPKKPPRPTPSGGTRKIKNRNKYTKKYYLNRIHNTIKNFYKTNKRKSRYNKKRL